MPRQHHPKDITINDPKLKVVRPVCCGMDIHKDIIVATIASTNMGTGISSGNIYDTEPRTFAS